ncbi:UNVERIFIED_CONTAM: hypothetical protein Slati_1374300 [Sesamum latifolium]|uniref:Uncharacterized protein n=1 Tax=Sesamum latifolium TaxID=2727402 RepID=A0AAW2XM42_9LAMI
MPTSRNDPARYACTIGPFCELMACDLVSSHPASSWPATLPARGMLSSRPASWLPCPSNGPPSLSFKAIQLLKELIPN